MPSRSRRTALCIVLIFVLVHSVSATSIVAKVGSNRILFAADTHGDKLNPGSQTENEDQCKIVPLAQAAFAVTGNIDYIPRSLDDPIASWDSRADVSHAYETSNGDLLATVQDWSSRAERHYSSFYRGNPQRVAQLASANDQNILLAGFFAGFHKSRAMLVIQLIYLDAQKRPPVLSKQILLPPKDSAYTSNAITKELIEGSSERALTTTTEWKRKISTLSSAERDMRWLEFLIQETSRYDRTVGRMVVFVYRKRSIGKSPSLSVP